MNKVILMGRLVRDPEVRYSQGENSMAIARYTLAVDRKGRKSNGDEQNADFIRCVAFNKSAEFAEKYLRQGLRILISGRIQTGSYNNRDGQKVHTVEIVIEEQEFADGKQAGNHTSSGNTYAPYGTGYSGDDFSMGLDGSEEGLPYN